MLSAAKHLGGSGEVLRFAQDDPLKARKPVFPWSRSKKGKAMNTRLPNRRQFLETIGAVGAASLWVGAAGAAPGFLGDGADKLALNGGPPVRKTPHTGPYGPSSTTTWKNRNCWKCWSRNSPSAGRGAKSKVPAIRAGLCRAHRGQVRPGGDFGYHGPVYGAGRAADRPGRRGHSAGLDLVRRLRSIVLCGSCRSSPN